MRIAVSATDKNLDALLDTRFGRAAYFVIVDPDTMTFEAVSNHQNLNSPQGAGIQAGQTIVRQQVDTLITGNCGPKAFKVLATAGINIMIAKSGRVRDVVAQFKQGVLETAPEANVEGHWV